MEKHNASVCPSEWSCSVVVEKKITIRSVSMSRLFPVPVRYMSKMQVCFDLVSIDHSEDQLLIFPHSSKGPIAWHGECYAPGFNVAKLLLFS